MEELRAGDRFLFSPVKNEPLRSPFSFLFLSLPLSLWVCVSSPQSPISSSYLFSRTHIHAGRAVKQMHLPFCTSEAQQRRYPAWRRARLLGTEGDRTPQGRGFEEYQAPLTPTATDERLSSTLALFLCVCVLFLLLRVMAREAKNVS